MFFSRKKGLEDDEDELGAAARAVIYSFTDDVDSGAAYWMEAYAVGRDVLHAIRGGDTFLDVRVVATSADRQSALDRRAMIWNKILSTEVLLSVPSGHVLPQTVEALRDTRQPVIIGMRCMQLHPVVQKNRIVLTDDDVTSSVICGVIFGKLRSQDFQNWVTAFEELFRRSPFVGTRLDRLLDYAFFLEFYDVPVDRCCE
jgi:hypothetical protein